MIRGIHTYGRSRRRSRGAGARGWLVACAHAFLLLALFGVPAPAGAKSVLVHPSAEVNQPKPEKVKIGAPQSQKTYYRIDEGFPFALRGPGMLTFYVRGEAAHGSAVRESLDVVLSGLEPYGEQRWSARLKASSSSVFEVAREGTPTASKKIVMAMPAGVQTLTLTATSRSGRSVYARLLYEGPPLEEPAAKQKKTSPWDVGTTLLLSSIYDDNICRYSDANLEDFRTGTRPEKFAIETEDDLVLNMSLAVELKRKKLLFGKDTRLRVRYQRWDYARNPVKTNDEIQLRFRQLLRRYDYFEATYTYAPDSYIKNLSDREPFLSRTVDREYLHFEITRNAFDWLYRYRANRWLSAKFSIGRVLRFYNRPFLENDLWEWNFDIETDVKYKRLTTKVKYAYANVTARGYDEVGETLETSDNDGDGGYEKDSYRIRLTYRPKKSPYRPAEETAPLLKPILIFASWIDQGLIEIKTSSIYFQYDYARQFYTSERPLIVDPLHVGRLDESFQPRLVWSSKKLWHDVSLESGVRYTERTADAPAGVIGEDDPSEEKDYTGTRYWLSFNRSW